MSQSRNFKSLVSTSELASSLDKVKVLDGSWHMPNANRDAYQEYVQQHIPGARFFGIDEIKDTTVDLPHMLPTPEVFAEAVGRLGISEKDQVVVYDSVGIFSATRVYWTFKVFGHQNVSVLNGGLAKWIKEGRATETGAPKITHTHYTVPTLNKQLVRDYNQVLENARQDGKLAQVLDARPNPRFTGEAPEPRPGLSSGHMPGSISVPFNVVIEDGQLLDSEKLRGVFESRGVDLDKEIVASCGSGITASTLYFALEQAGAKNIAVYDGSWTEYADKKDSIIVKDQ
ncbi:Rhodanese-like domain-containing protein [Circinella umbellata]|nr:Rhodanese-like domain-containing protein [Circinella umbellata]